MGGVEHGWGHVTPCRLRETQGHLGTELAVLCPAPSPLACTRAAQPGPPHQPEDRPDLAARCGGGPGSRRGSGMLWVHVHTAGVVRTVTGAVTGAPGATRAGTPFPD